MNSSTCNLSWHDQSSETQNPARRQSFLLEPLESRLLLSVSSVFDGTLFLTAGTDVNASALAGSQVETHIAINPTEPGNLVVMSNGGLISNEFTATSTDAAANWTTVNVGNAQDGLGATGSRFDGATAIDAFGNVHIVYQARPLTNTDPMGIVHAMSSDGGLTYTVVNVLTNAVGVDKPWIAVGPDAANPANQTIYITHRDGANQIVAYGATVTGLGTMGAFTAAVAVSDVAGGNYAVPTVGPDGELVITWQRPSGGEGLVTIFVDRDLDGLANGLTFGADTTATTSNGGGFDFIPATPERSTFASPYIAYDRSGGAFDGRLYMVYADELIDENDDFDIFLRFSGDDGANWSAPVQVNPDDGATGNSQFFQAISVDQDTGAFFISWYDASNDLNDGSAGDIDTDNAANSEVQYFATASMDGGLTFLTPIVLSDGSSDEDRADPNGNDFGDYTGIAALGGSAFATWGDNSNSTGDNPAGNTTFDVYVDRVVLGSTGGQIVSMFGDTDFFAQDDTFEIVLDASGTFIQFFENETLEFTATLSVVTQINVFGFGGNDTLIVDSSNGLIDIVNGIRYDGGSGFDELQLLQTDGDTQTSDTYSVGPEVGSGVSTIVGASGTQTVFFEDLSPVLDLVPAALLMVNATAEDNAISYTAGLVVANGLVAIDEHEPIEFSKKAALTINAGAGQDTISLNNSSTPDDLTGITINGGDPSGGDAVIVTGDASAESVVYTATASDGGTLDLPSLSSLVFINSIEVLSYDGQGGGDSLTVVGTSSDDTIVHTPGANDQAGSFQVNNLLALDYEDLGIGGSLTANGDDGADTLVVNGTAVNDLFTLGALGEVALNTRLVLNSAFVETLTLEGLAGDDTFDFNLVPSISASVYSTINLNGGGQASATGDRVINLKGTAVDDAIIISGQNISLGGVDINSSGIEDIRLDALTGADLISYNGVDGVSENIIVSSSGVAGGGQLSVTGVALINFSGVEQIDVINDIPPPATETDTLTFVGTNAVDRFEIDLAADGSDADPILQLWQNGSTAPLLTLRNYTNFDTLNVSGLGGADTFNVYTDATGPSRDLFVDGGLPSGKGKSTDTLNIFYTPPRPSIIHSAAIQDPDAGIVDLDYGTARFMVQYDAVEKVPAAKRL